MMDIKALKDKILQLATQGKLVPQDENDEDASVLLGKIKKEKEQLIKDKKIKKDKLITEISKEEIPFEIPNSWKWVRLVELSKNCETPFADGPFGSNLKSIHYTDKQEVRIIQLSNIGENGWKDSNVRYTTFEHSKTIKRSMVECGDLVIAKMMPAGRTIEVPNIDKAYILSSDAVKFVPHPKLDKKYLLYTINSDVFKKQINAEVQGTTRVRTSLTKIKGYLIPLPPLEEQKRIVAKVDSLFKLIDELDNNKQDLLQNILDSRSKVLQLAIQGKLVSQNENDEPASVLLEKIKEEKEQLIKDKVIKKEKGLSEVSEEEKLFDLPNGWEWSRLGNICRFINGDRGKNYPSKKDLIDEGVPFINAGHLINGEISKLSMNYISEEKYESLSSGKIKNNDMIYCLRGTLGKNSIVKEIDKGAIASSLVIIRLVKSKSIDIKFLYYFINSKYELIQRSSYNNGSAQPNLSADNLKKFLIPLPPLSEQKRIVAKVDAIMDYLDMLEKQMN